MSNCSSNFQLHGIVRSDGHGHGEMNAGDRTPELSALFVDSRMLTGISVFKGAHGNPECECDVQRLQVGIQSEGTELENCCPRKALRIDRDDSGGFPSNLWFRVAKVEDLCLAETISSVYLIR